MKKQPKKPFSECFMQCHHTAPPEPKSYRRAIAAVVWYALIVAACLGYGIGIGIASQKDNETFWVLIGLPLVIAAGIAVTAGIIWAIETRLED